MENCDFVLAIVNLIIAFASLISAVFMAGWTVGNARKKEEHHRKNSKTKQ